MKAVVFTLGCKVNEVESASILASLEALGWEVSARLQPADVYILNTCAVTREAEKKSRQLIARVRKLNAQAKIYVCGCASQKDAQAFLSRGVAGVFGARNKQDVLAAVTGQACAALSYPKQVRTRAFVKISDGCNNFCSYCVIPYLRGRVENRPIADVVAEVLQTDSQEIVLTGINISAYDCGGGLAALITALQGVKKRVRLGSLECNVIDDNLLTALKNLYDFAPQFHLSLQSGSDSVLKAMNRKYTRAQYLQKCQKIYEYFPDAAITTDIIAGFPSETEEDFLQSLSLIKEAKLARVHAFAFSPREGTVAYRMQDISADVKSERLHRLLRAAEQAEENYIAARIGKQYCVLWEQFENGETSGYTENYIKVYAQGNQSGMQKVTLNKRYRDGAKAEV